MTSREHLTRTPPACTRRALTSEELAQAVCRGTELALWFGSETESPASREARQRRALHLCARCPIQPQCLAVELRMSWRYTHYGIRGGMTPRQREHLLRLHPEAADWPTQALAALIGPSPHQQLDS